MESQWPVAKEIKWYVGYVLILFSLERDSSAVLTFRWVLTIEKKFILICGIKIEFCLWVTIKYYLAPLFGKMLRCVHK